MMYMINVSFMQFVFRLITVSNLIFIYKDIPFVSCIYNRYLNFKKLKKKKISSHFLTDLSSIANQVIAHHLPKISQQLEEVKEGVIRWQVAEVKNPAGFRC